MNTLTKVAAGQYAYRGLEIVRATWIRDSPWVIKHELLRGLSYSTLREAVGRVDGWFADRDAGRKQPDFVAKALDSLSQPSLVRVGDIVRYEHPVEDRLGCGRVLGVDERFLTVDGECCGLRMRVRVKHGKAWLDEKLMEVMKRAKRKN